LGTQVQQESFMTSRRFLVAVPALLVLTYGLSVGPRFDRFVLPAFDGHVYAAMAESPRVFTLAPWGYRILEPWIVHILPAPSAAAGFFWLNLGLLAATVCVLFAWLTRLGFSHAAAALSTSAFALSPPLRGIMDYQVLVDPLALLLAALVLHESVKPRVLVLIALFSAIAISKEAGLSFLVVTPLAFIPRHGWKRGAALTGLVVAPALALTLILRMSWGNPAPSEPFSILNTLMERINSSAPSVAAAATLSGLTLLAFIGLFRETSTALRIQGLVLWFLTFLLLLSNPYQYSAFDLPRLSVYAWPALLPLALSGLGFKRSLQDSLELGRNSTRAVAGSGLVLLVVLGAVASTDSYDRAPFEPSPDPVAMLGRLRESLKAAQVLEEGGALSFDAESGRFAMPVTERFNLTEARQQRWFLYRGFGPDAAFGSGTPAFEGQAEILAPLFSAQPTRLTIAFDGAPDKRVNVSVGGVSVGWALADQTAVELILPKAALVRGDNIMRLDGPEGVPIQLRSFSLRLATASRR